MENEAQPITQPVQSLPQTPAPTPIPVQPTTNKSYFLKSFFIIIGFILFGILIGVFVSRFLPTPVITNTQEPRIEPVGPIETPTLTPTVSQTTTPTPNPTANWKTYINSLASFSLKYPLNVVINQDNKNQTTSTLNINVTKINDIQDQPFNFTKETAIKDQQSLQQGKYGEHIDWPTGGSEKVITIGGKPAKTYTVFAVLEVCDVRFERTAIVYNQDFQIILKYIGPNTLKQGIPNYLITDTQNCGDEQIWNQNTHLFQDLESKKAPATVQSWHDTFDQILSTFKFSN